MTCQYAGKGFDIHCSGFPVHQAPSSHERLGKLCDLLAQAISLSCKCVYQAPLVFSASFAVKPEGNLAVPKQ